MRYLDLPVIDGHIHVLTNDSPPTRVPFHRHEEIVTEIFQKSNYEAATLLCYGYTFEYYHEKTGSINLMDMPMGYYLKDKCKEKLYLFGSFSRNYHKPELNTQEFYLEQAKFRHAAGCDGFKSLDGILATYRTVGARISDPVTDLYYDYLEKNHIPIMIHLLGPYELLQEDCVLYPGKERVEEYREIFEEITADVEELMTKFPKLTLIFPHFYFQSKNLDKVEEMMDKWENVYFDLTPNIFMYHDFNQYPDDVVRSFFVRRADRILYGTDTFIEENIRPVPLQVEVVRDFFEKEHSDFLAEMGIRTLPLDEETLKKIYYKNMRKLVGPEPRPVNPKMVLEECSHLMENYRPYLLDREVEFLQNIQHYFENR